MRINPVIRRGLQKKFGKNGYRLFWNHGGYSLQIKQLGKFIFWASDAETYCKETFGVDRFYM